MLEIYTDAVVKDLTDRLADKVEAAVFGGSTKAEWFRLRDAGELPMPHVMVNDFYEEDVNTRTYAVLQPDGSLASLPRDPSHIPFKFGVGFAVFAECANDVDEILGRIHRAYGEGVMLQAEWRGEDPATIPVFVRTDGSSLKPARIVGAPGAERDFPQTCYSGTIETDPPMTPKPCILDEATIAKAGSSPFTDRELVTAACCCERLSQRRLVKKQLRQLEYFLDIDALSEYDGTGSYRQLERLRERFHAGEDIKQDDLEGHFDRLAIGYPGIYDAVAKRVIPTLIPGRRSAKY